MFYDKEKVLYKKYFRSTFKIKNISAFIYFPYKKYSTECLPSSTNWA